MPSKNGKFAGVNMNTNDENQCPNNNFQPKHRTNAAHVKQHSSQSSPATSHPGLRPSYEFHPRKSKPKSEHIAKLSAIFSNPNNNYTSSSSSSLTTTTRIKSQKDDLIEREKRRMQMLQERRMQQGEVGVTSSSSWKGERNVGYGNANDKTEALRNGEGSAQGKGRQTAAGTGDETTAIKTAKIKMQPNSGSSNGAPQQGSLGQYFLQLTTLSSRLLILGVALYEIQFHCAATFQYIHATLQIASHYTHQWAYFTSLVLGKCQQICINLLPRQCWCLEMWCYLMMSTVEKKSRDVMSFIGGSIQFILGRDASWDEVLHVVFVITLAVRCVVNAFKMTVGRFKSSNAIEKKQRNWLSFILFLLGCIAFWMTLVPVFNECQNGGDKTKGFKYCFFVESVSKRAKNEITSHVATTITNPRYSLADIVAFEFYQSIIVFVTSKVKSQLRKEIHRAVMSPFKFHDRLKKLFTILRWAKFLAPLIGTCNKLRGHVLDMIRKRQQHVKSKAAQKRWREVMLALSKQSKLERAVLQLQKSFREKRQSKAKRRYELMSPHRSTRVSKKIRRTLLEEQNLAKSKLEKIEEIDYERKMRRQVSQDERTNISNHKERTRKKNKRLLLSPKTTFAVGWKFVAIACVALEISQILFAPMLSGEMTKMPLDKFLSKVLFATGCKEKAKKAVAPSFFIPAISEFSTNNLCTTSSVKQTWLLIVRIIATILVPTVKTICFLDVFITFFTGELTSSGTLLPKPFFARFILPGIGLQLIVNPTMIAFSKLAKRTINHATGIGPSLSLHLVLGLVPFIAYVYDILLDFIFDFVEKQNKIISRHAIFD